MRHPDRSGFLRHHAVLAAAVLAGLACGGGGAGGTDEGTLPPSPSASPTGGSTYFPREAVWYRDVSADSLDRESNAVIAYLSADEVAAGSIDHAIRFILPNSRIRRGEYVHPATHGTRATTGPPEAPPYGARLRLRADYPLETLPNDAARTVARAMQLYGMLLADGGQIALTAQSDRFTRTRWPGLLDTRDLAVLRPRDFEMVEAGEHIPLTPDCVRNP